MADTSAAPVNAVAPSPDHQEGKVVESQPNTTKVYVGNLSWEVSSDALKKHFEDVVGEVLLCEVIQRRTKRNVVRSAGYGFVEFSTDEAVKKAIDQLNGKEFEGRTLKVALPDSDEEKEKKRSVRKERKRVGRRGSKAVPGEVSTEAEEEANGEVDKHATDAEGENKPKKKKKKSAKKFKKAKKAPVSENGTPAENGDGAVAAPAPAADGEKKKRSRPNRAPRPRRPAGEEPAGEQSKTTLLVANLPFSVDDDGLADIFKKAEFSVTSARVVRLRWGHPRRSKGYGFVSFADEEQQQKALHALQGAEVPDGKDGVRKITLKIAIDPVPDHSDTTKKDDAAVTGEAKTDDAPATADASAAATVTAA